MASRTKLNEAIELLKEDHATVKGLFNDFEDLEDRTERQQLVEQAIRELTVHSKVEEELFYPAVKEATNQVELIDEAEEEHHVIELLIEELKQMDSTEEKYPAKFVVLMDAVRRHIRQEENEIFPKANLANIDFEALGTKMVQRKQALLRQVE